MRLIKNINMLNRVVVVLLSLAATQMAAAGPLHEAVCEEDIKEINRRIDEGFDINWPENGFGTPLQQAVLCGQVSAAELLIKKGAKVDAKGGRIIGTPLFIAAYRGNTVIAKLLIEKGADVNAKNNDGSTPLHAAAFGGHVPVAKLLINKGADVGAKKGTGVRHCIGQPNMAMLL